MNANIESAKKHLETAQTAIARLKRCENAMQVLQDFHFVTVSLQEAVHAIGDLVEEVRDINAHLNT